MSEHATANAIESPTFAYRMDAGSPYRPIGTIKDQRERFCGTYAMAPVGCSQRPSRPITIRPTMTICTSIRRGAVGGPCAGDDRLNNDRTVEVTSRGMI